MLGRVILSVHVLGEGGRGFIGVVDNVGNKPVVQNIGTSQIFF